MEYLEISDRKRLNMIKVVVLIDKLLKKLRLKFEAIWSKKLENILPNW